MQVLQYNCPNKVGQLLMPIKLCQLGQGVAKICTSTLIWLHEKYTLLMYWKFMSFPDGRRLGKSSFSW